MRVGVGLPSSVPNTSPELLAEWARRADEGPYSSVGVVDRIAYRCYEPLTALAVAAGVTNRVHLVTMVVIGPLRRTAVLAMQAASLHQVSGGRLTLGLAVGARTEDYDAAGIEHADRGQRFDEQLADLREWWEKDAERPGALGGEAPELIVGGTNDAAFARMARHADGYVHGGGPPRAFARAADKALVAWADAGRPGRPALWAQGYFALGDDARDEGLAYMRDYYAFTGPFAEKIAAGLLTTPQGIVQFVRGYAEEGCDELVLLPATSNPEQLDRLADVLEDAE